MRKKKRKSDRSSNDGKAAEVAADVVGAGVDIVSPLPKRGVPAVAPEATEGVLDGVMETAGDATGAAVEIVTEILSN